MRVGSLNIVPIHDGIAFMPIVDALRFTGTREDAWGPHDRFRAEGNTLELAMGGFLIETGGRVVLIDTGLGPLISPPFEGGKFMDSLGAAGFTPEAVTDVCFTHLHFDHVGWATSKGKVMFPNATYRCHREDWRHFIDGEDPGAVRKLTPIANRMEFWEADGTLFPGIDVTGAPGHTPGSTIFVVSDGGEQAVLLGDVVHCPVELIEDDWEALYDVDPALAQRTRAALAREYTGKDVPMVASHFPGMQFGRLLEGVGMRSWLY